MRSQSDKYSSTCASYNADALTQTKKKTPSVKAVHVLHGLKNAGTTLERHKRSAIVGVYPDFVKEDSSFGELYISTIQYVLEI